MKTMFLRSPLGHLKRSCVHPLPSLKKLYWGNGRAIRQPAKLMEILHGCSKMTLTSCLSPRRRESSSPPIMKRIWLRDPRGSPDLRNGKQPASSPYTRVRKRNLITSPLLRQPICLTCSEDTHHQLPHMICKPPQLTRWKTNHSG